MKGPEQLPDEDEVIKCHVGTGLRDPAHVRAEVTHVGDEQVQYRVLEVLDIGSLDDEPDDIVGAVYGTEAEGFVWSVA